jgi:hypothetical protein
MDVIFILFYTKRCMNNHAKISLCFLMALIISINKALSQTDTIFYNKAWQFCERPIAAYYRVGTLSIDSFWFYSGKVKDYTVNNTLVMEGEYSPGGDKNGLFNFYYPNGNLQASGHYKNNVQTGNWKWNYINGNPKAEIYFPVNSRDFYFNKYFDEKGKAFLENTTGDFVWYNETFDTAEGYKVYGSFKNGKRSGTWKYYYDDNYKLLSYAEVYDNEGKFKKKKVYANRYYEKVGGNVTAFIFEPDKIQTMEDMAYDNFFKTGTKAESEQALIDYLIYRKPTIINVKDSGFERSYYFILRVLDTYRKRLDYVNKPIEGQIDFRLNRRGYLEDITVEGQNITNSEKELLIFIMKKFRNVKLPGTATVAEEGYHRIYFYTINVKEFMPSELKNFVGDEIVFNYLKKDQFLALLKAGKKDFKKYIREEFLRYR